jgi:hypothetical protein
MPESAIDVLRRRTRDDHAILMAHTDVPTTTSPDELLRMAFPVVARTEKEFRAPFSPKGRFAGLTIEHLEVFNAEDRFWARFQLDGAAKAFGAQWAAFARAALFPTLVTAPNGGVNDPRAIEFLQQLEVAVAQRMSNTPEKMQIPLASIVLIKNRSQ